MKTLKQIDEELFQRFKKAFPLMPNNQISSIIGMFKSFTEEWLTQKRDTAKENLQHKAYFKAYIIYNELLTELNNEGEKTK